MIPTARQIDRIVTVHNALSIAGGMVGKFVIFADDGTARAVVSPEAMKLIAGMETETNALFRIQAQPYFVTDGEIEEDLQIFGKK